MLMQPRQARPSGFKRQSMTIAGLMMIVALVAFYVWLFRASLRHKVSPLSSWRSPWALTWSALLLQIKWKHWISADPDYEPIDADSDQVPLRVAESIEERRAGSRPWASGRSASSGPTARPPTPPRTSSLFEDPRARCTAQLFTVFAASGLVRQVTTVLNFRTEFTDGTSLSTANSRTLKFFPPVRIREGSMAFPWIDDPRALYEIHRASVAYYAADGIPRETDLNDPAEFLRASSRRTRSPGSPRSAMFASTSRAGATDTPGRGRSWGP